MMNKLSLKDLIWVALTTIVISVYLHTFGIYEWDLSSIVSHAFFSTLAAYIVNMMIIAIANKTAKHRGQET